MSSPIQPYQARGGESRHPERSGAPPATTSERARLALAGFAVCTFLGLVFASHFRVYYGVDWPLALWWGLKDWYLWGALAPAVLWLAGRFPVTGARPLRALGVHLAAALALAWVHPTLAISLSAVAEGLDGEPFLLAVHGLFLKRYAVSFVTYAALVALGHALAARRRSRETDDDGTAADGDGLAGSPPAEPVERLLVKRAGRERFLSTARIERIEAEGNYVRLHAGGESFLERRTLKSLEGQLDAGRFLRIHRSHLVNVDRIDRIEPRFKGGYEVVLGDGTRLPLSRTYRKRLEERIGESL